VRTVQPDEDSSLQYGDLLHCLPDGIVAAGLDGQLSIFNPAAIDILGIGPTDADPHQWPEVYGLYLPNLDLCPWERLPLARAIRGEHVVESELVIRNDALPSTVWVSARAAPVYCERGSIVGGSVTFHEITARKRAEQVACEYTSQLEEINLLLECATRTDSLTGLVARGTFDSELVNFTQAARQTGSALCLILIDADHFKRVNDTFGHQVGDIVLRELANRIRSPLRKTDIAARFGGEELAVILPMTTLTEAILIAERILERVASDQFVGLGHHLGVTVSVGLAGIQPDDEAADILQRADVSLYEAKRSGRNCLGYYDGQSYRIHGKSVPTDVANRRVWVRTSTSIEKQFVELHFDGRFHPATVLDESRGGLGVMAARIDLAVPQPVLVKIGNSLRMAMVRSVVSAAENMVRIGLQWATD